MKQEALSEGILGTRVASIRAFHGDGLAVVQINEQNRSRLNVLLAQDRLHAPEHWIRQLPRFLEPHGIASYVTQSAREAIDVAQQIEIHAAIIELGDQNIGSLSSVSWTYSPENPGGIWLIELFRRLRNRPPVVLIRGRYASPKQVDRLLREALRMGVFSVLNDPVDLEQILAVFRRLIDRQYRGAWPGGGHPGSPGAGEPAHGEKGPNTLQ